MKILLGVCGSISAYKSYDLVRELAKVGHEVRVILSQGALEFINPKTFTYLGAKETFNSKDDFEISNYKDNERVRHIDLANWADKFVIAPLSANILAKLAGGFCDDLLSSIFLSFSSKKEILMFPAMNTTMLNHPFSKENFQKISNLENVHVHRTKAGKLICGETGLGKLADVSEILDTIECITTFKKNKKVVITSGATIAPIDSVRFLTNPSSGKTGYQLAKQYLKRGFDVTVISGYLSQHNLSNLEGLPRFKNIAIYTTSEMFNVVKKELPSLDIYVSAAAISDIEFIKKETKLKKDQIGNSLEVSQAPDILDYVVKNKQSHQKIIGFAAESPLSDEVLISKWCKKPTDLLVGNVVEQASSSSPSKGFKVDSGEYHFLQHGKVFKKQKLTKLQLSKFIAEFYEDI